MKTILAAIDYSDATEPVLKMTRVLARNLPAKIVLMHVIKPAAVVNKYSPVRQEVAAAAENYELGRLAPWRAELRGEGFTVETCQPYGPPADCIRGEDKRLGADYIVMGSPGHGALHNLFMGSTASTVLNNPPCPVWIVPTPGLKLRLIESAAEPGAQFEEALSRQPRD